jgi:hypothetical protein
MNTILQAGSVNPYAKNRHRPSMAEIMKRLYCSPMVALSCSSDHDVSGLGLRLKDPEDATILGRGSAHKYLNRYSRSEGQGLVAFSSC